MYDVIVIGSGPGGMTAALYAARAELSVLVIERGVPGGQMNNTAEVENYPGFDSILGPDLAMKMYELPEKFGAENTFGNVQRVEDLGSSKKVYLDDETSFEAKVVIVASGCEHRKLGVKGENEYAGSGVSYCAVCDGAFFRDKHLFVVGGGDSAIEEGVYLTQFASKVTIVHRRDALRAQKILQKRAFDNPKIDFIWDSVVEEITGDGIQMTGIKVRNVNTEAVSTHGGEGIFIYVGLDPLSEPFKNLGILNEAGWIETNEKMETSCPGIYAVGDVRATVLRQITTAVGDGSVAGQEAYKYIELLKD